MDRHDRYFHEVALTQSLRKAADGLRVASSAVSRSIHILEEQLGSALFERAPQGMLLTEAGKVYFEYTSRSLKDAEQAKLEIESLKGLHSGHIRVISVEGIVADFIIPAFEMFRRDHPGVTLDVRVDGSHAIKKAIGNRDADIGVSMLGSADDSVDVAFQIDDPLLAVMSPQHEWAGVRKLRVQDIIGAHPYALLDQNFRIRSQVESCVENWCARPVLVANSIGVLRSFARRGGGITFLPFLAVRDDIALGWLAGIPLIDKPLQNTRIEVSVAKGRRLPLPVQTFLGFLHRTAATLSTLPEMRPQPRA